MTSSPATKKNVFAGIILAIVATLVWSGNFVVARGIHNQIPPIALGFFRWATASLLILPVGFRYLKNDFRLLLKSWKLVLIAAFTGITLFNTFIYIGAHYTSAINLALIGNTVSPVVSVLLAAIFLKEKIGWLKALGIFLCLCGVFFLLMRGNIRNLLSMQFSIGDGWMVLAALSFSIYTVLARQKPAAISFLGFLTATFIVGALLLFPFYLWESQHETFVWNRNLLYVLIYLGLGTSIISFFCWNYSIKQIGAGRTALFGNLIPIFSSIEAVIFLNEPFTMVHLLSMLLVFAGLLLANLHLAKQNN
ncbi:MAG: DMT family transporter [Chitinophagaceae bacterium]